MTDRWPEHPDDSVDPAFAPLIESGEGEAEGFDVAERELIDHASHGDYHGTGPITADASDVDEELEDDEDRYGEPDEEGEPDW